MTIYKARHTYAVVAKLHYYDIFRPYIASSAYSERSQLHIVFNNNVHIVFFIQRFFDVKALHCRIVKPIDNNAVIDYARQ